MDKQSALEAMVKASQREQEKPPAFLNAWKDAVHLAGPAYFDITCASIGQATDINQLRPKLGIVFQTVGSLSTYERVFLLGICQFYADSDVRRHVRNANLVMPSLADFANLDDRHRHVIMALLDNYSGW